MTLHFGVIDLPYEKPPKKAKRKSKLKSSTSLTTGDVAEILEAKYHPFELFFQIKEKQIAASLENSMAGALESLMMGAPAKLDPFGAACSEIEALFGKFINNREIERLGYPGIPTKAALAGVNHRLAHPYAKGNKRRPSFVDTSQYIDARKVWVD